MGDTVGRNGVMEPPISESVSGADLTPHFRILVLRLVI